MDMQTGPHTGLAPSLQKLPTRRPISGAILRRLLSGLACGSLTLELPNGQKATHAAAVPGPDATLIVRRWRVARRLLLEGQIGFAESYIDGDWTTPDLAALIELAARNQDGWATCLWEPGCNDYRCAWAIASGPTPNAAAAAISARITTWATISTPHGWIAA